MKFVCEATANTDGTVTLDCVPKTKKIKDTRTLGTTVVPVVINGTEKLACDDCGTYGKYDRNPFGQENASVTFGNGTTVTFTSLDGVKVDWAASGPGVLAIAVKGGTESNKYSYNGSVLSDTGLVSPLNSGGQVPQISHIDICFNEHLKDINLDVTYAPGKISLTRTFDWSLSCSAPDVTLSLNQQLEVDATLTATSIYTDSNFVAQGTITIKNPSSEAVTITRGSIECGECASTGQVISGGANIPAGGSTIMSFVTSAAHKLSDFSFKLDYVPVNTCAGGSRTLVKDFEFGPVTDLNLIDEGIELSIGNSSPVRIDNAGASASITGKITVGPYSECGKYQVLSGSLTTLDNHIDVQSACTVNIEVPCAKGCTLTQGYWKTHSKSGPAPYDPVWASIGPQEEKEMFYVSNQTYLQVMTTAPAGNPYYILAPQFIAAVLNRNKGTYVPESVSDAITAAIALFTQYAPVAVKNLSSQNADRVLFKTLASTLDSYNNGLLGPVHCSE